MALPTHRRAPYRRQAGLPAVVLALVLGALSAEGEARAQVYFPDLSGAYMPGFALFSVATGVPALVADLGVIADLAQHKPVALGWSVTGLAASLTLSVVSAAALPPSLNLDQPAAPALHGVSLVFGGVSLVIAAVGLHFRPGVAPRSPAKPAPPKGNDVAVEVEVEVALSGQWAGDAVAFSGTLTPSKPAGGGWLRLRVELMGQDTEWLDLPIDAQGRFAIRLAVPAGLQRCKATAIFKESSGHTAAMSDTIELFRPAASPPVER